MNAPTVFPQLCHKCDRRCVAGETVYQPSRIERLAGGGSYLNAPPVVVCERCKASVSTWDLKPARVVEGL